MFPKDPGVLGSEEEPPAKVTRDGYFNLSELEIEEWLWMGTQAIF